MAIWGWLPPAFRPGALFLGSRELNSQPIGFPSFNGVYVMARTDVILRYADYAALPPDGRRYELHRGELVVTAAPSPLHQTVAANLYRLLYPAVRARQGRVFVAPLDVILDDTTVVQPDVVFLDVDRLTAITSRGIEGPPTLVVEVLSPATATMDRRTKRQLYARYQVPSLWLIDPEARTLEAYVLRSPEGYQIAVQASGDATVTAPPFPDFALRLADLWEGAELPDRS